MAAVATPPAGDQLPTVPNVGQTETDKELARLKQSIGETQKALTDTHAYLRAREGQSSGQPPPSGQVNKQELTKEFFKNPLDSTVQIAQSTTQAMVTKAMAEIGDQLAPLKLVAKREARSEDPERQKLFDKYIIDIEARVATMPPNFQTNLQVWNNAYDMVVGSKMREILAAEREEKPSSAAIHVSRDDIGPARGSKAPPPAKGLKLSDDQKLWASRLGLSDEQYSAGIEAEANQSQRGKSSWDAVITTDSTKARKVLNAAKRAAASKK